MGFWRGSSSGSYPDRVPADDAIDIAINDFTLAQWVGPPAAYYYKIYLNGQDSGLVGQGDWFFGGVRWCPTLVANTSYEWYVEAYASNGVTVIATAPTWTFTTEAVPSKASTPAPGNAVSNVTLDQATLGWVDGGGAETFNVYYGDTSGDLSLVSSAQAGASFTVTGITLGSPYSYLITRYWRIDSTNAGGTTTGDEWSFTTIRLSAPTVTYFYPTTGQYYQLLIQADGSYGDVPGVGVENTDYIFLAAGYLPNFIKTTRKLVSVANSKVWYEDI